MKVLLTDYRKEKNKRDRQIVAEWLKMMQSGTTKGMATDAIMKKHGIKSFRTIYNIRKQFNL